MSRIPTRTDIDPAFAENSPATTAAPDQDMALTVLLIVEDQDRTRAFYEQVLGASVVRERDPVILKFHNSWIVANVGGSADRRQTADNDGSAGRTRPRQLCAQHSRR